LQLIYRGLRSAEKALEAPSAEGEGGTMDAEPDPSAVEATRAMLHDLLAGRQRFALLEPLMLIDVERLREAADPRVA